MRKLLMLWVTLLMSGGACGVADDGATSSEGDESSLSREERLEASRVWFRAQLATKPMEDLGGGLMFRVISRNNVGQRANHRSLLHVTRTGYTEHYQYATERQLLSFGSLTKRGESTGSDVRARAIFDELHVGDVIELGIGPYVAHSRTGASPWVQGAWFEQFTINGFAGTNGATYYEDTWTSAYVENEQYLQSVCGNSASGYRPLSEGRGCYRVRGVGAGGELASRAFHLEITALESTGMSRFGSENRMHTMSELQPSDQGVVSIAAGGLASIDLSTRYPGRVRLDVAAKALLPSMHVGQVLELVMPTYYAINPKAGTAYYGFRIDTTGQRNATTRVLLTITE